MIHPRHFTVLTIVLLGGCDMGHLPNPVLLPVHALSNGVANTRYNARRARVSDHVTRHHAAIIAELRRNTRTPQTDIAAGLAAVPVANWPMLRAQLSKDIALYADAPEPLIVAFMVHGP